MKLADTQDLGSCAERRRGSTPRVATASLNPSTPASELISDLITSVSNPRIKFVAGLRDAKDRKKEGLFLIDGLENISLACQSSFQIQEIFVCETLWQHPSLQLTKLRGSNSFRWTRLSQAPLQKLQYGQQTIQAVAVARTPDASLETLSRRLAGTSNPSQKELYLVLDRLEKPGNLGAAMRTADAAGVTAVLLSDPTSEAWNPNAIRASLGAIFTVPLAIDSWSHIYRWLKDRRAKVYAARTENGQTYTQVRFPEKLAIVIGSEAHGLQERWQSQDISSVHIPMFGQIDSLNASVTGSILLFEVVRQWQST